MAVRCKRGRFSKAKDLITGLKLHRNIVINQNDDNIAKNAMGIHVQIPSACLIIIQIFLNLQVPMGGEWRQFK